MAREVTEWRFAGVGNVVSPATGCGSVLVSMYGREITLPGKITCVIQDAIFPGSDLIFIQGTKGGTGQFTRRHLSRVAYVDKGGS